MSKQVRTTAATYVERRHANRIGAQSNECVWSVKRLLGASPCVSAAVCLWLQCCMAMTPLSLLGVVAALLPVHVRALNNGYTLPAMGYRCVDSALHFRLFFA